MNTKKKQGKAERSLFISLLLSCVVSALVCVIALAICSRIALSAKDPSAAVRPLSWLCIIVCGISCGISSRRFCGHRSPLSGLICGGMLCLISALGSLVLQSDGSFWLTRLLSYALILALSCLIHILKGKTGSKKRHRSITSAPSVRSLPPKFS